MKDSVFHVIDIPDIMDAMRPLPLQEETNE